MSLLALLGMTLTALLTGGLVLRRVAPEATWPVRACAGFVVLHLLWQGLDGLGVAWSPLTLFLLLGAALLGGAWALSIDGPRRGDGPHPQPSRSIGLLALAVPTAAYGWAALTLRAPYADFVYHWGAKARRFALVEGIDWESLGRAELFHSDYPLLVSELFAVNRLLAGVESEASLLLWSVVFFALSLVALWDGARQELAAKTTLLTVFAIGCGVAAFSIRFELAGGPDINLALAVILAGSLLSRTQVDVAQEGWQIGVVAAFAAASKLEGVLLAALLVALFLWRRRNALRSMGPWRALSAAVGAALPVSLVVLPWLVRCLQYGLFQESNAERFDPSRLGPVLVTAWGILFTPEWLGLPLVVLSLPWLITSRFSRWWVLPGALLLGVYLAIYLVSPHEPAMYVTSNFARLLLHVVPVFLVGLVIATARPQTNRFD